MPIHGTMRNNLAILFILLSLLSAQESDSSGVKNPMMAAKRALIFPGMGQIYTEHFLKAGLIAGLEVAAVWRFNANRLSYRNFTSDAPLPRHRYLEKRNKYAWWVGFIYIYGLLDAVVDAHLSTFHQVMDVPIEKTNTESENDREQDL
ncbi:MAG: hypothetical protein GXO90_09215 [FCB group bacterium]|nr:hypothetical protein [FCB group bacterium]